MKLSQLVESTPNLQSASDEELEQMLAAAEKKLRQAAEDSEEEMKAENLASQIEREIYKRAKK